MKIRYNNIFKGLLLKYNLPTDLSFTVELPREVKNILDDQILVNEHGVTLSSFNRLYKATQEWENQSVIEDQENHFHVDWHVDPADNKKVFMLGIKTLTLLAAKFQKEKMNSVRFWYSFQTPELGKLWAQKNNLEEIDDEHVISDRLSFYKLRDGEEVVAINNNEENFWAVLTIDI